MSLFKRISATLVSRIDHVVGEIENHDAVIQVALGDMRKKIAEARVRLNQVQREAKRLGEQAEEQRSSSHQWRERAIKTAPHNEKKAMDCLSRAKQCEYQVERLLEAQSEFEMTSAKLANELASSEQKLQCMQQKQTLMRARQSTGQAVTATNEPDDHVLIQIDDSFDRWEMKLNQLELTSSAFDNIDPLAHEFDSQERDAMLKAELMELLKQENKS